MPTFKNAEEMVHWILHHYEPVPLVAGDEYLDKLIALENRGRLTRNPEMVLLALQPRKNAAPEVREFSKFGQRGPLPSLAEPAEELPSAVERERPLRPS